MNSIEALHNIEQVLLKNGIAINCEKELEAIKEDLEVLEILNKRIIHQRNLFISIFILNRECERHDYKKVKEWLEK